MTTRSSNVAPSFSPAKAWLCWTLAGLCLLPWVTPPVALLVGLAFALTLGNPQPRVTARVQRWLLQASVMGLGFAVNFQTVVRTGFTGAAVTVLSLAVTLLLGYLLARLFRVERVTGQLVSIGTAICGGSAIAAMGPVLGADEREMSVALGCVFLLNAVALFIFPVVGHWAGLDPTGFGWWAAIAIHDTSSVAGAAARYAPEALATAIPVKLARALWIVPAVVIAATAARRREKKLSFPWFVPGFVATSLLATFQPAAAGVWQALAFAAKSGLSATLFLIGTSLTTDALRRVGWRPFLHALSLWIIVSVTSLALIRVFFAGPASP